MSLELRAREIAEFLGIPEADAIAKLSQGFGALHAEVNEDFRRCNPQSDEELLEWYRSTNRYIFELSAYHEDAGFNYAGMCRGITERLIAEGAKRVLCLGDGIGDLTLGLLRCGFKAVYHDLAGSITSEFAHSRGIGESLTTGDWNPEMIAHNSFAPFDAVVSLDFMEHLVDPIIWCKAIFEALKPGGWFAAQNAFDCGSGPDGSIPCHLAINDKFAHAGPQTNGLALWDHMLFEIGFKQSSSNWYFKPL